MRKLLLLLIVALAAAAGCFVSFDPEGQLCDKQKKCLAGYHCDATNHCAKGSSSGSSSGATSSTTTGSSGTHGSSSGSTTSSTGTTTTGTGTTGTTSSSSTTTTSTSSSTTGTTGATSCTGVICPATQECQLSGGTASCVPRTTETCSIAAACANPGELCISAGASAGVGICVSACTLGAADAGCPSGASCQAVLGERGNTFSACMPSPLPRSCTNGNDCALGQVCTPYDSPSGGSATLALADELPVLFCDRLDGNLLALGAPCSAPSQCQNGVCALEGDGGATCRAACNADTDCNTAEACSAVAEVGLTRHVRACVSVVATGCNACGSCGPDAPGCITAHGTCALACDTSDIDPCGHGRNCVNDGASTYCAVSGTTCP